MRRRMKLAQTATGRQRNGSYRPQLESLEHRLQPGDALISGVMATGLLGAAMVPVAIGPTQPLRQTGIADATAGRMSILVSGHTIAEVQGSHPAPASAVPTRTAALDVATEGIARPHLARQGEHLSATSGIEATAAAGAATTPPLPPSGFAHIATAGSPQLPDGLAGLVASGGRAPNLANNSTLLSSVLPIAASGGTASPAARAVPPATRQTLPAAHARHPAAQSPDLAAARTNLGRLPLTFEANQGQADGQVQFLAHGPGYNLFLTGTGAVLALAPDPATQEGSLVRLNLTGANPAAPAVGLDEQPGKVNYLHGNDPAKWQVNVPTFAQVQYQGVYPGIDLVYYGSQQQLEYDFRVAPGADPRAIQLAVTGPAVPSVDAQGNLVLHTPDGDLVQHKPVIYQETAGGRQEVAGGFQVQGTQVRFAVGAYDPSRALIIDPVLSYSTYLGGSGNDSDSAVKVDAAGNIYVTGSTTSANYPTLNPFQSTYHGGGLDEAFVTKLNPAGTALLYSTYLGGTGPDDANALAIDANGNAYITGSTGSTNFPVTAGAFQRSFGGGAEDVFVTKLNPSGSGLVYSTYLGGTDDDSGAGIVLDGAGNAYITGDTASIDFPTTASAYSRTQLGFDSAYLAKLNASGTALVYSTYLGADVNPDDTGGNTYAVAIALDGAGNAYITGETDSMSYPVTAGAFQRTYSGGTGDAFVAKLNPAASGAASLVYSSFLGGSGVDCGAGIAVDSAGNAYVAGTTESVDFPTANPFQSANGGGDADAFVTKVNAAGTALVYSTYLGGLNEDDGAAIVVDAAGDAYVAGTTNSNNFPTLNAIQASRGGSFDSWVTKFSPSGTTLVYSTYLGGSLDEGANALTVDPSLNVYITGNTDSTNYPTTTGAYQGTLGGISNGFISKISDVHFQITPAAGSVTAGTPFTVTVTALDAAGNPALGYRGTVHFASTDGRATLPANYTFTAADNGVHTFTNGVTLVTAGSQTLTLTDGALNGSTAVTVQAAAARTLQLTGVPSSVAAGTAFTVTVTARDQYNNVATGYRGIVSFSSTDAAATLPAAYTFTAADGGVHTFTNGVTLVTPGNQMLSISDGTLSASATTTVTAGAAVAFRLTGPSGGADAGVAFTITVTAIDGNGNPVSGYRGTVHFTSSDGQASLPADYTFTAADAGVHTFAGGVTLRTAASQTLTARDTLTSSLSGSTTVLVRPGAARTLQLTGVPTSTAAGAAFTVTVTARDQYNNVATGYRGTVSFSSTDGRATLPAAYTFTAADGGVHTFSNGVTLITAGNQTLSLTDGTLSTSAPITVQPGTATTLQLSGVPSAVGAGTAFTVTITALDRYNNLATGYRGTITFSSTDTGAVLPAAYTFTATDSGVHTFSNGVTLVTAGAQTVSLTDGTLNASAATTVQPGTATTLQLSGVPSTVVAGTTFVVTVTALDQYNNVATSYQGTVSFSSSDAGATLPANYTFTAADGGVHTFSDGVTLITAGNQTLTITDGTLTTNAVITVTPAPAVALVITAPSTVNSGTAFDITVTAVDPYGNTDVNYTGTVSFSSSDSDPGVVLPASYTFSATDQGSVYFPGGATLITPGTQSITATDGAGITGSVSITVTAGGFPNRSGGRQPSRNALVDLALAAAPSIAPGAPLAGSSNHPAHPDATVAPAPDSALDHAQVDRYFTLPLLESYGADATRRDRDFQELLPQLLEETLVDL